MVILRQNGEPKKSRYGGGSITKLPSGSWILKWYGPADQDGNRKRLTHTFKGIKANANKKLRELQSAVDDGSHVDKSKETVKQFGERWQELDGLQGDPVILHCHHGMRSQQAAMFLKQKGFSKVYNLAGGIDAWSQAVDSAVPRY